MQLSDINYKEKELNIILKEQFKSAFESFHKFIFPTKRSVFSKLHKTMSKNKLDHNCIACNLSNYADLVYMQVALFEEIKLNIHNRYTLFIMTIYLFVERIDTILNVIELHEGYRKEHFSTMVKIRKWANFIKHPKAFILVHHPEYTFESSPKNSELRKYANLVIDYNSFIQVYYSDESKNQELYKKLENKDKVLVIYPEASKLMDDFCQELNKFISIINNNEIYREILNKKARFKVFGRMLFNEL